MEVRFWETTQAPGATTPTANEGVSESFLGISQVAKLSGSQGRGPTEAPGDASPTANEGVSELTGDFSERAILDYLLRYLAVDPQHPRPCSEATNIIVREVAFAATTISKFPPDTLEFDAWF